jgi:uncharacterized lipoprotein YmbA
MLAKARLILLCILSFVLYACSTTQQSKFYLLEALENTSEVSSIPALKTSTIELRVAAIPGYLDRPQIITRGQNYNVEINEYQRWAEPLKESFTRVLAANINSKITPAELDYQRLILSTKIDYRLLVKMLRFDSDSLTGDVLLNAKWSIQKISNKNILVSQTEKINIPVSNRDFTARVRGHSQAIAILADRIAAEIKKY